MKRVPSRTKSSRWKLKNSRSLKRFLQKNFNRAIKLQLNNLTKMPNLNSKLSNNSLRLKKTKRSKFNNSQKTKLKMFLKTRVIQSLKIKKRVSRKPKLRQIR